VRNLSVVKDEDLLRIPPLSGTTARPRWTRWPSTRHRSPTWRYHITSTTSRWT